MNAVAERKIKNYDLIVQAKEGSEEAMEGLIQVYNELIWKQVRRVTKEEERGQDLYQIGAMALIEAVHKFDLNRGYEFMTYLYMEVRGRILVHLRDNRPIRFPRPVVELGNKIKKENLQHESVKYISNKLKVTEEKVMDAFIFISRETPLSMDEQSSGGNSKNKTNSIDSSTLGDLISKDMNGDTWEDRVSLDILLAQLPDDEREVTISRYFDDMSQKAVGQARGISQTQVTRIEAKALNNLRRLMEGEEVKVSKRVIGRPTTPAGNQGLAKELTRKGELSQVQISKLTGVSTGTIGFWKSKLRKGKEI